MHGYLIPTGRGEETVTRVTVEAPVGVYRADADHHRVVVETEGERIDLGISDATVSRKKEGTPPVEFVPERRGITVHNRANRNNVVVDRSNRRRTLARGDSATVRGDCTVSIGYNTDVSLTVQDDGGNGGPSTDAYVRAVAENLRKARRDTAGECLKYANDLRAILAQHEVADPDYGPTTETLEAVVDHLEAKANNPSMPDEIDEQWSERIERIAHRVEELYARSNP